MFSLSTNALRRIGCLSSVKLFRVANSNCSNLCSSNFKLPGLHISSGGTGVVAAATAATTINQRCFADQKQPTAPIDMENKKETMRVNKEELKKRLTPMQYQVTQEAATERPFTGCYNKHYEKGVYQCIVCHQDLFSSDTKYDAGCGWPAFNDVLDKGKITLHRDASIPERIRTEVRCAQCNAHMGHVFEDGPKPTRKRYCINSAAIEFLAADELNSRATSGAAATTVGTPIAQQ